MTVGELKKELDGIPDHWRITFGGVLVFYRIKNRGEELVDVEFTDNFLKLDDGTVQIHQLDFDRDEV